MILIYLFAAFLLLKHIFGRPMTSISKISHQNYSDSNFSTIQNNMSHNDKNLPDPVDPMHKIFNEIIHSLNTPRQYQNDNVEKNVKENGFELLHHLYRSVPLSEQEQFSALNQILNIDSKIAETHPAEVDNSLEPDLEENRKEIFEEHPTSNKTDYKKSQQEPFDNDNEYLFSALDSESKAGEDVIVNVLGVDAVEADVSDHKVHAKEFDDEQNDDTYNKPGERENDYENKDKVTNWFSGNILLLNSDINFAEEKENQDKMKRTDTEEKEHLKEHYKNNPDLSERFTDHMEISKSKHSKNQKINKILQILHSTQINKKISKTIENVLEQIKIKSFTKASYLTGTKPFISATKHDKSNYNKSFTENVRSFSRKNEAKKDSVRILEDVNTNRYNGDVLRKKRDEEGYLNDYEDDSFNEDYFVAFGDEPDDKVVQVDAETPEYDAEFYNSAETALEQLEYHSNSGYADWTEWEDCSVTCGTGHRQRFRKCVHYDFCSSGNLEMKHCHMEQCR